MNSLRDIEELLSVKFPNSFHETLSSFDIFFVFEKNNDEFEVYSLNKLLTTIEGNLFYFQYMAVWKGDLDNNFFVFGSSGDGKRIYFNLEDLTVWEYWLDDNSSRKIYQNFEMLITDIDVIEKD